MTMIDWQLAIVIVSVVAAATYIARATWRTWHPKPGGCGGGCGCKSTASEGTDMFVDSERIGILHR
jgi:hypothetical protein